MCQILPVLCASQLCLTLNELMDCSPPGCSIHGILQARILELPVISYSREFSQPKNRAHISCVFCNGRQILDLLGHLWNPKVHQFSSVQLLSHVRLCNSMDRSTPGLLSITNYQSLLKLMSIESMMPSNHLILCCPLLLPSIFPSSRVFSNESVLHIRWPNYWSFTFSISPSDEYSGLISFTKTGWISLQSRGLSRVFFNTTV